MYLHTYMYWIMYVCTLQWRLIIAGVLGVIRANDLTSPLANRDGKLCFGFQQMFIDFQCSWNLTALGRQDAAWCLGVHLCFEDRSAYTGMPRVSSLLEFWLGSRTKSKGWATLSNGEIVASLHNIFKIEFTDVQWSWPMHCLTSCHMSGNYWLARNRKDIACNWL